jgi:hypothetical protein
MKYQSEELDDLRVIRGIGQARAKWFYEALNIHTLCDLANLSSDMIETRIRQDGLIASHREIESWITQAKALVAEHPVSSPIPDAERAGHELSDNCAEKEAIWKPVASFVVEFQTKKREDGTEEHRTSAHHMEADQGAVWHGIQPTLLCQWMLSQCGLTSENGGGDKVAKQEVVLAALPPQTTTLAQNIIDRVHVPPVDSSMLKLQITQIQAFQPEEATSVTGRAKPGQPFLGFIKSNNRFAIQATLELASEMLNGEVEKCLCKVQFYALNSATGVTTHLGDTECIPFGDVSSPHKATLHKVSLEKGLYRLKVHATVETEVPAVGYLEIPFLRVV